MAGADQITMSFYQGEKEILIVFQIWGYKQYQNSHFPPPWKVIACNILKLIFSFSTVVPGPRLDLSLIRFVFNSAFDWTIQEKFILTYVKTPPIFTTPSMYFSQVLFTFVDRFCYRNQVEEVWVNLNKFYNINYSMW